MSVFNIYVVFGKVANGDSKFKKNYMEDKLVKKYLRGLSIGIKYLLRHKLYLIRKEQ